MNIEDFVNFGVGAQTPTFEADIPIKDVYTKTEINAAFYTAAYIKQTYYTRPDIDAKVSSLTTAIDGKQASLGFTPVQQGGGTKQNTNKLYIGWGSNSKLRVQVDATDFGDTWPVNVSGSSATAGWADNAGNANTAGRATTANSADRSTSAGIADWATNAGNANTAGSSNTAGSANKLVRKDGYAAMVFDWNGQGGQPSWLWGGNDGTNMYVYNPANFSVNYANGAGNADTVDGYHAGSFLRADSNNASVRITPGDGNGVRFWDTDTYSIFMSARVNGTWGGDFTGGSDYNMYFRMGGGEGRGFVFKNDSVGTIAQITGAGDLIARGALFLGGGTNGSRLGTDGNLYMPWAGDWLSNVLGGKAAANHTHAIANITGLQTTLDTKQASLGYTPVNRAGDVMSGALEIKNGDPTVWLHKENVKRARWAVDGNGTLVWQDQGGQNHFYITNTGAIWSQQFGDLYQRIEDRAWAWATDRATALTNNCVQASQMQGYIQHLPGVGSGNIQSSSYVFTLVNRYGASDYLFGSRQPQLYIPNRGWFAAFPFS